RPIRTGGPIMSDQQQDYDHRAQEYDEGQARYRSLGSATISDARETVSGNAKRSAGRPTPIVCQLCAHTASLPFVSKLRHAPSIPHSAGARFGTWQLRPSRV